MVASGDETETGRISDDAGICAVVELQPDLNTIQVCLVKNMAFRSGCSNVHHTYDKNDARVAHRRP